MQKKILFLLLFICLSICLTGCHRPKTMILFNKQPITKENLLQCSNEFIVGKRLYYIFITEAPLDTNMVRIRIITREAKVNNELTKVVYSNDFKLSKDQIYYYNDYITIHAAGDYCMAVYAKNRLDRPLVTADFRVKD